MSASRRAGQRSDSGTAVLGEPDLLEQFAAGRALGLVRRFERPPPVRIGRELLPRVLQNDHVHVESATSSRPSTASASKPSAQRATAVTSKVPAPKTNTTTDASVATLCAGSALALAEQAIAERPHWMAWPTSASNRPTRRPKTGGKCASPSSAPPPNTPAATKTTRGTGFRRPPEERRILDIAAAHQAHDHTPIPAPRTNPDAEAPDAEPQCGAIQNVTSDFDKSPISRDAKRRSSSGLLLVRMPILKTFSIAEHGGRHREDVRLNG
jgi:hypothetical protein